MRRTGVKVALNMNRLPVAGKINRARFILNTIASKPLLFPNPKPSLAEMYACVQELTEAWNNAADGGKRLTALMHDAEENLMFKMNQLAHYVSRVAGMDEAIVHAAGMEVKSFPSHHFPDFMAEQLGQGKVRLRVKPMNRSHSFYRWQYNSNPAEAGWQTASQSSLCDVVINELTPGTRYWFRVLFIGPDGDLQPYDPISLIAI